MHHNPCYAYQCQHREQHQLGCVILFVRALAKSVQEPRRSNGPHHYE